MPEYVLRPDIQSAALLQCFTAFLLLYCCFTAVLPETVSWLLYCCFAAALPLLYCCSTDALLMLYCCFTAALLLLYCCFTAVLPETVSWPVQPGTPLQNFFFRYEALSY
jgi:hypothetical protein